MCTVSPYKRATLARGMARPRARYTVRYLGVWLMSRELRLTGLAHVGDDFTLTLSNHSTCIIAPERRRSESEQPLYRFAKAVVERDGGLIQSHGSTIVVANRLTFEIVAADEDVLICEYKGQVS